MYRVGCEAVLWKIRAGGTQNQPRMSERRRPRRLIERCRWGRRRSQQSL